MSRRELERVWESEESIDEVEEIWREYVNRRVWRRLEEYGGE